jgi:hypothetical protein
MGVSLQDRLELPLGTLGVVAGSGKKPQVGVDLLFVPGEQDRLDVREVLVQRRAADAGGRGAQHVVSPQRWTVRKEKPMATISLLVTIAMDYEQAEPTPQHRARRDRPA